MPNNCLNDRATALVNAVSKERHQHLLIEIHQIGAAMNSRNVFHSSMHVNEVSKACASELRNIAGLAWENVKRAHESCGSKTSEDVLLLYLVLLQTEKTKMEQVVEGAVGGVAKNLLNQSLVSMLEVSEAYDDLVNKYKVEIDIYISNLKQGVGATHTDRIRHKLLNRPVIAFLSIVVLAIVSIAGFTEAISKLSTFLKSMLG